MEKYYKRKEKVRKSKMNFTLIKMRSCCYTILVHLKDLFEICISEKIYV